MKTRRSWELAISLALLVVLLLLVAHRFQSLLSILERLSATRRQDVLFSFIGDKNGDFRPTIEHLNTFVRSFRAYNRDARVVIFFTDDHRKGQMKAFLDEYHVETPVCQHRMRHVHARFFCERDYLAAHLAGLNNVFHSDTDVVFQGDPFDMANIPIPAAGLVGFGEAMNKAIASSHSNKRWIADCYGEEVLARLGPKARLCAGTVAGSAAAYLLALTAVWLPKLPRCNDQGVYLYSWHMGVFEQHGIKTTMLPFATGPVATLNAPAVRIDKFGRVVNEAGAPYVVLHMAKRHPIIRAITELRYPLLTLKERAYSCRRIDFCDAWSMRKIHDREDEDRFDRDAWNKALGEQAASLADDDDYVSANPFYHQMLRVVLQSNTTDVAQMRGARVQSLADEARERQELAATKQEDR